MIPGENAEPTGIDGQRTMQAKLGREVGHGLAHGRVTLPEPEMPIAELAVKSLHDLIVELKETRIVSQRLQAFGTNQL